MESRTYRYRAHVREMPKVMAGVGVLLVVGLGVFMLISSIWALAPVIFVVAVQYVLFAIISRRLASTTVTVGEEGIRYKTRSQNLYIPYGAIERIESRSILYLGGWLKIHGPEETIRITIALEGISKFIRSLKKRVDLHNARAVYDRRKLFGFFKTAAYSEQSWARLMGIGNGATVVWMAIFFAPVLALTFVGVAAAIPLFAGIVAWAGAEAVFAWRLSRSSDEIRFVVPERDVHAERRTYFHAAIAWVVMVVPSVALLLL